MDGIHDLGGVQGFGPVVVEEGEPVFHHRWERRVFGLNFSPLAANADRFRHAIERMDPVGYLTSPYYEHWLHAIETLAVEAGAVTPDALADARRELAGSPDPLGAVPRRLEPAWAVALVAGVTTPAPAPGPVPAGGARFSTGERVTVHRHITAAHTRCPRYARGATGTVDAVRGTFRLPDASASGDPDRHEPLYSVVFAAADLWGPGPDHTVALDMWESYLEPADGR